MGELEGQTFLDTIKNFFMIREYYFQLHPKERMIFEEVLLHPPKHLVAQIQGAARSDPGAEPQLIRQLVKKCRLRPGVDPQMAARYLESVEYFFQSVMQNYQGGHGRNGICTPCLKPRERSWTWSCCGIMRQSERKGSPRPHDAGS